MRTQNQIISQHGRNTIANFSKKFYDASFHKTDENYISSPLGVWLLLATVAGSTPFDSEESKSSVEELLGLPLPEALQLAEQILNLEGMETTNAAWFRKDAVLATPKVQLWLINDRLTDKHQNIPTSEWLDSWVDELTHGLIKKFPIQLSKNTLFIFANILYTKFDWLKPFESELTPENMKSWNVEEILTDSDAIKFYEVEQHVVAVHSKYSANHQAVLSIICDEEIDDIALLNIANRVVTDSAQVLSFEEASKRFSLGTFTTTLSTYDRSTAYLPAWSAEQTHDLSAGLKFNVLADELMKDTSTDYACKVKQTAVAKYTKTGFEAAAATVFMISVTGMMRAPSEKLFAEIPYIHTYATVCSIAGVPVFTGLVRKADPVY